MLWGRHSNLIMVALSNQLLHFPPFPSPKFPLTMDVVVNYGYSGFLGDLNSLLVEGRTMEEPEIEVFGICVRFVAPIA